jgi:hypothetical protein
MFKKKTGIDVYDFTLLHKKGIIKVPKIKDDYVDLSGQNTGVASTSASTPITSTTESSPFNFLDNLAQSSSSEMSAIKSSVSNLESSGGLEIQGLKNKIEDLEYKLDRFLERIDKIEEDLKNKVGIR